MDGMGGCARNNMGTYWPSYLALSAVPPFTLASGEPTNNIEVSSRHLSGGGYVGALCDARSVKCPFSRITGPAGRLETIGIPL